jgi:hypothetical protein
MNQRQCYWKIEIVDSTKLAALTTLFSLPQLLLQSREVIMLVTHYFLDTFHHSIEKVMTQPAVDIK